MSDGGTTSGLAGAAPTTARPAEPPASRATDADRRALLTAAAMVVLAPGLAALPAPVGLAGRGHRVLVVTVLAIGLWAAASVHG